MSTRDFTLEECAEIRKALEQRADILAATIERIARNHGKDIVTTASDIAWLNSRLAAVMSALEKIRA